MVSDTKIFGKMKQERDSAEEKFISRWSLWDYMSYPSREELHLHPTSERSDWQLLLLPISGLPQGSWRVWRDQGPQQAKDPGPLP